MIADMSWSLPHAYWHIIFFLAGCWFLGYFLGQHTGIDRESILNSSTPRSHRVGLRGSSRQRPGSTPQALPIHPTKQNPGILAPRFWIRILFAWLEAGYARRRERGSLCDMDAGSKGILTTANETVASIRSQVPRLSKTFGVYASALRTKFFQDGLVNDKLYELEGFIQVAASLPPGSDSRRALSRSLIRPLWNDLRHPPLSYVGNDYRYRRADGSNNNISNPRLGAAGSAYARTVTPQILAAPLLPDPGLVFDTIFARQGAGKAHPNQISSLLFYLATIITHDIFRTDESDHAKVKNSSYLDLSPLYGNSDACVADVRAFKDGMLIPDTFSESRVYGLPPGVAVLLICFNRFHNHVASQLKAINEGGRFDPYIGQTQAESERQIDEDLFQTARLITCAMYVNIILRDYVGTILHLQTAESSWTLDPRDDSDFMFRDAIPCGVGNQVSVEFNLVYRWHSAISERDARWVEDLHTELSGQGRTDPRWIDSTAEEFRNTSPHFARIKSQRPREREIRGLRRNHVGKYDDGDLVEILTKSTEDVAGAFGPRNVPAIMKMAEVMGIKQARRWKVCTLNEFRRHFRLAPYRTFAEISSNPDVARALKTLYAQPDYVELYPGLVAEDAKMSFEPASGLCPGFTVSRTILADAVALVRGDRFYTVDYSSTNLTNWGWNLVNSDPDVASGGVMYKLLMRSLPSHYRGNSVYAMFPFVHPHRTRQVLEKMKKEADYDFAPPKFRPPPKSIKTFDAVAATLRNATEFKVPWGPKIRDLTGRESMLGGDTAVHFRQRIEMERNLYQPCHWPTQVHNFYREITREQIQNRGHELQEGLFHLDVVKDVANPTHTLFVAYLFHIPVQECGDFGVGPRTDELYAGLAVLFAYVFLDQDPVQSFRLRVDAKQAVQQLSQAVRLAVQAVGVGKCLRFNHLLNTSTGERLLSDYGKKMIERLIEGGKTVDEIVAAMLPTMTAAVATQARAIVQILEVFLDEEHRHHWPGIRRCAYSDQPEDFERLKKYALEACRLVPAAAAVLRTTANDGTIPDGPTTVHFERDEIIHLDFAAAGRDETRFPDHADQIDVGRSLDSYLHQGLGRHECLGQPMTQISLAVQLGEFAKLKNLRRVPGPPGQLKYKTDFPGAVGTSRLYMTEDQSNWSPFPTTWKLQHEGFCEELEDHGISSSPDEEMDRIDSAVSFRDEPKEFFPSDRSDVETNGRAGSVL